MGSGTTQAVAMKLGRRFIGADINLGSVQTTTKRLLGIAEELGSQARTPPTTYLRLRGLQREQLRLLPQSGRGKKELLIKALDVQPFEGSSNVFDGELDGRMVKILPTDRIATKA